MPRYNKIALNKIIVQLEEWTKGTLKTISNEEDRDYPNEPRLDILNERFNCMNKAVNLLQEIE